jgi:DNA mismatch repair protein MutS2
LKRLAERIGDFYELATQIDQAVDGSGRVRDTASERLMAIRGRIEDCRAQIRKVYDRLLRTPTVLKVLQYPNWTFQGDRMVLPVRANYRHVLPGIVHRSSDSGATLFVEPSQAVELNNEIIRLGGEEEQEVSRILWELAHRVHQHRQEILVAVKAMAKLDMISAKARHAMHYRCVRPRLNDAGCVDIQAMRHPVLIELLGDEKVVAIDIRVGDDFDLMVITGPNTGGKTVALKAAGLAAAMTQSGMFLPAASAEMPIFDDVYIDVGDEQSLQQSLSTFSSHLTRILDILRRATSASLVLIDELGAGTDPEEGAAIGQAILDEFLDRRTRTLASTHLAPLKSYAFRCPRAENASVDFDPQTLRPSYRLRIGEPGNSNAMAVAKQLGMPTELLDRATTYVSEQAKAFQQAIEATIETRRRAEQARTSALQAKAEAEHRQRDLDEQRKQLDAERQAFQDWLAWVNGLKVGDSVYVKRFRKHGTVMRMELHKQVALVRVGVLAAETPLSDLQRPDEVPTPATPERRR